MKVKINLTGDIKEIDAGAKVVCRHIDTEICKDGTEVCVHKKGDCLEIAFINGLYHIFYSAKCEFFRGLSIVADKIRNSEDGFADKQKRCFETCGTMLDCSRNAVAKVSTVKDYLERMALMGLDMFMLYTEDTYEMDKYPWFGYMRGAYTHEELREIDSYALMLGIELVPCIQTLAHLSSTLRWPYARDMVDTADVLLVGSEKTKEFVEEMLKTCAQCFTSRRIHIGFDEAGGIGMGRYLREHGYRNPYDILMEHLTYVCGICEKYGFKPMMWSDMFFKFGQEPCDYSLEAEIPKDIDKQLPKNLELVYWDYCMEEERVTDFFLKRHLNELHRETVFAGGIWTWNRMCANMDKSFITAKTQLQACENNKIKTVFVTIWNNLCALYNLSSTLPGLQYWAERNYCGTVDNKKLAKMFGVCTGYSFDDFMALSIDDFTAKEKEQYLDPGCYCINSSAQHFFNDILIGLLDETLSGFDFKSHYQKYKKKLAVAAKYEDMNDVFEQTKILVDILKEKCVIGPELRAAYKANDHTALKKIAGRIKVLIKKYEQYHKLTGDIWYKTYKPFGWEATDITLAGVEARTKWALSVTEDYLAGKSDVIEELEAKIRPYNEQEQPLTETDAFKCFMSAAKY